MVQFINLKESKTENDDYQSVLKLCENILRKDGIIAVPTDTVYGLACLGSSKIGIEKIYSMKGRDRNKPLAICVSNFENVRKWSICSLTDEELSLFLPGKSTLLFKKKENLLPYVNPNIETVALRIPNEEFLLNLCNLFKDDVLVLTSANITNESSTLKPKEFSDLWPKIDCIIKLQKHNSRKNNSRLGSTIIDLSQNGNFKIVREGENLDIYIEHLKCKLNYMEIK